MKKYKLLKIITSSLGVVSVIGVGTTSIVSCSKKNSAALNAFIKAAKAENADNIVANANPTAPNWENLSAKNDDLTIENTIVKGKVVTVVIQSESKAEVATFSATYKGSAYTDSVWICSQAPSNIDGKTHSWADFKTAADNDTIFQMLSEASTQKTSWKTSDKIIKLTSPVNDDASKTITITLADRQASQQVNFVATYTTNRSFQSSDWATPKPPIANKDNLVFKKINLPNPAPNFPGSNVQVKIGAMTYLGGTGGLWTSTDNTTWTKNKSLVIPNTVQITAIVLVDDNIFVATKILANYDTTSHKGGLFIAPQSKDLKFSQVANNIIAQDLSITRLLNVNTRLFIGTENGLFVWIDAQTKPILYNSIVSKGGQKNPFATINILKLSTDKTKIIVGTLTNGIWTGGTELGAGFSQSTMTPAPSDSSAIISVQFIIQINNDIYAYIGGSQTIKATTGLYVSKNNGESFTNIFDDKSENSQQKISGNSVNLFNNDLYLSTTQGLYISSGDITGTGLKFNISTTLDKDISVSNTIEHKGTINTLYAGTNKGLFTSSSNTSLIFFTPNTSIPASNVDNVTLIDNHIFVDILNSGDYTT